MRSTSGNGFGSTASAGCDGPQFDPQLIDIDELQRLTLMSKATIWRMEAAGRIPPACRIGRSVRWRLRTGDPATGIADWIEAGCPTLGTNSGTTQSVDGESTA